MPPRKSVFRQPGARHFQVVHRSQRDPLIYDVDASKHVLKEYARENEKKVSLTAVSVVTRIADVDKSPGPIEG
jgi:hypothetical protein